MLKKPYPQDHGWAWVIVCGCFVCVFFMVGTAKSTGMFLTEFQTYFNVPTSLAAMVMGGSAIVYALLAPVCIMLGQMFTVRQVIITGGFIGFVGMSLGSLLFSMEYVIATFGICFGIGNASIYGNCLVILGMYFSKKRTLANGLALTGSSIGQFAMPPIIEFLLETYGLQGCLLLVSGVYFNVVAAASLFRPLSFWASQGEEGIALQERCTLDKNQQNQSREDVSAPASAHNGPTIGDSEGRSNKHTLVEETGAAEENGRCEMDSPVSPLVSTSADGDFPSKPQKSLPGNVAMHPAHMGSVSSLPQSVYGSSMLFDPHGLEAEQMEEVEDQYEEVATNGLVQKLASMFDFSVMKSYVAVFIAVFSFLSFFGYFNFVLFLPATVMARGIDKYDKAILVSVCGIGDLLGRLTTAAIGDRNFITRYKLQAMGTFACGINIGGFLLARSFGWMISHAALYGFFGGIYVSLAAVVIIDFVGLTKMPKLLAVVMLIQGVGASVGQPLLGGVKDATGSFQGVIAICCLSCIVGSIILLCYPLVIRLEIRRPEQFQLLPVTSTTSSFV